jgi:acyl phosphate:glycerol-3-phosphate acyltransferase
MDWLYALGLAYLLGSIPFGLILTRLSGAGDLRSIGSGNIGATNVLRTGNKGLAAATLLLDAGKGAAAVLLVGWLWNGDPALVVPAGLAALIGHCYPAWLRFSGGKGVATMLGVSFAFDWRIGLAAVLAWLGAALLTRISSLGGMIAAIAAPIAAYVHGWASGETDGGAASAGYVLILSIMALVVIWQHRANIARLLAGTEPRIGAKPQ